jgi:CRP-like cAMP-binding protein
MPHSHNLILSKVSPADLHELRRHLNIVELKFGQILAESRGIVHKVYFPHGGIISSVVELTDGSAIETGMIGKDGLFGAAQALDHKLSLNKVIVQVPGVASVIEASRLKEVANNSSDLRALLIKYEQFFLAQVQQTTACNALHNVEQRTCRWLARMYDLVGGKELPLTQEFLAQMMGVQRTSVSAIAGQFQEKGLISYRRGKVTILNINLVHEYACECPHVVREHYVEVFGNIDTAETHSDRLGAVPTMPEAEQ